MYSYGILLFEVYSFGGFPFATINDDTKLLAFLTSANADGARPLSAPLELAIIAGSSPPLAVLELLRDCVNNNPAARPSATVAVVRTSPAGSSDVAVPRVVSGALHVEHTGHVTAPPVAPQAGYGNLVPQSGYGNLVPQSASEASLVGGGTTERVPGYLAGDAAAIQATAPGDHDGHRSRLGSV